MTSLAIRPVEPVTVTVIVFTPGRTGTSAIYQDVAAARRPLPPRSLLHAICAGVPPGSVATPLIVVVPAESSHVGSEVGAVMLIDGGAAADCPSSINHTLPSIIASARPLTPQWISAAARSPLTPGSG